MVIVVDAHNGFQLRNNYTGLKHNTPTGKTVFEEYHAFFDELSHFAQVVYGYSDCSERFQMDLCSMKRRARVPLQQGILA